MKEYRWEYDGYIIKEYVNGKFTRYVPKDEQPINWTSITGVQFE